MSKATATSRQPWRELRIPEVLAGMVFTGLAWGTLLAAAGLALGNALRQVPGLPHAVRVVRWLAGALLAIGAVLLWQAESGLSKHAPRLILMAALAAPPAIDGRRLTPWSPMLLLLPALAMAGIGFLQAAFRTPEPMGPGTRASVVGLEELAMLICGGLGARSLGQALSEMITSAPPIEWPSAATYALLTLLVGGIALVNLWQQGSMWSGTADQRWLTSAWLAWSAARVSPRQLSRVRTVLVGLAASFLVALATGY